MWPQNLQPPGVPLQHIAKGGMQIELNQIAESAETTELSTTLKSKCESYLTNINNKCEKKAAEYKDTFKKKRTRDNEDEPTSTDKCPRLNTPDLNSTQAGDAAITNLFQAVNDVIQNKHVYQTLITPPSS